MKSGLFLVLFVICYAECRKTYTPIDKNANLDFIHMEAGGLGGRGTKPGSPTVAPVAKPVAPAQPAQPTPVQPSKPAVVQPAVKPTPVQPAVKPSPVQPAQPSPVQPKVQPTPVNPVPVYPTPAAHPITTPGPGSVKSLVNFYDSQGKGSVIRPYSYSQAVKQG